MKHLTSSWSARDNCDNNSVPNSSWNDFIWFFSWIRSCSYLPRVVSWGPNRSSAAVFCLVSRWMSSLWRLNVSLKNETFFPYGTKLLNYTTSISLGFILIEVSFIVFQIANHLAFFTAKTLKWRKKNFCKWSYVLSFLWKSVLKSLPLIHLRKIVLIKDSLSKLNLGLNCLVRNCTSTVFFKTNLGERLKFKSTFIQPLLLLHIKSYPKQQCSCLVIIKFSFSFSGNSIILQFYLSCVFLFSRNWRSVTILVLRISLSFNFCRNWVISPSYFSNISW